MGSAQQAGSPSPGVWVAGLAYSDGIPDLGASPGHVVSVQHVNGGTWEAI